MVQYPTSTLVAIATGVIGSGWMTGAITSFSIFAVPVALEFPDQQVQLWHKLYLRGAAAMPKVAIPVALSYAYAAYDTAARGGQWQGFATAAALVVAIVPFTLTAMNSNIAALKSKLKSTEANSEHAAALVKQWSSLNVARAIFPLAGTVVGAVSLFTNLL
ncbi:hypothetical protein S40293_02359 [Stachybotrys chartarum IBT 40293]|nr:hypothetical protein S40293_02359 [Stachybotrys chartarum IBT 40293]